LVKHNGVCQNLPAFFALKINISRTNQFNQSKAH
jgi:hypothetical protein